MSDTMLVMHELFDWYGIILNFYGIYLSLKMWRDIKLTSFECVIYGWFLCHSIYKLIGDLI